MKWHIFFASSAERRECARFRAAKKFFCVMSALPEVGSMLVAELQNELQAGGFPLKDADGRAYRKAELI